MPLYCAVRCLAVFNLSAYPGFDVQVSQNRVPMTRVGSAAKPLSQWQVLRIKQRLEGQQPAQQINERPAATLQANAGEGGKTAEEVRELAHASRRR